MPVTPSPSIEAAHEEALNAHLQTVLGIPMNYVPLIVGAQDSPKGIATIQSVDREFVGNLIQRNFIVGVRIIVTHNDAIEGSRLLKDWGALLFTEIGNLRENGITGTYRTIELNNAFLGIKSIEPISFQSIDSPQGQAANTSLFHGVVASRYKFTSEKLMLGF
jgi:hypothetical protein